MLRNHNNIVTVVCKKYICCCCHYCIEELCMSEIEKDKERNYVYASIAIWHIMVQNQWRKLECHEGGWLFFFCIIMFCELLKFIIKKRRKNIWIWWRLYYFLVSFNITAPTQFLMPWFVVYCIYIGSLYFIL